MGTIDWTSWLWWGGALVLAMLALVQFYRAMLRDWLKTRRAKPRRCPKCWYDLSGTTSLRCSECGHRTKRERKLHKSRRRWRWVLFTPVLLLGALFMAAQPTVHKDGWRAVIPTAALLWVACPVEESLIGEAAMLWVHDEIAARLGMTVGRPTNVSLNETEWNLIIERGLRYRTRVPDSAKGAELRTLRGRSNRFDAWLSYAFDAASRGSLDLGPYEDRIRRELLDFQFDLRCHASSTLYADTFWTLRATPSWPGPQGNNLVLSTVVEPIFTDADDPRRGIVPDDWSIISPFHTNVRVVRGSPPVGSSRLPFQITCAIGHIRRFRLEPVVARTFDIDVSIDFEGLPAMDDPEIASAMEQGLVSVELLRSGDAINGVFLRFNDQCAQFADEMRLAIQLRLRLENEELACGHAILHASGSKDHPDERFLSGGVIFTKVADRLASLIENEESGWHVIIESDPALAHQDLNAPAYWVGRFEVPVLWGAD